MNIIFGFPANTGQREMLKKRQNQLIEIAFSLVSIIPFLPPCPMIAHMKQSWSLPALFTSSETENLITTSFDSENILLHNKNSL